MLLIIDNSSIRLTYIFYFPNSNQLVAPHPIHVDTTRTHSRDKAIKCIALEILSEELSICYIFMQSEPYILCFLIVFSWIYDSFPYLTGFEQY